MDKSLLFGLELAPAGLPCPTAAELCPAWTWALGDGVFDRGERTVRAS